ncbi:unnamed protein product [Cercospora beticola]|nr:unnamed protein product [Cercospora beticola]
MPDNSWGGWAAFIIPRTGAMQLAVPVNFAAAAVIFGWIGVHSTTGFIVWSVLYGVATGLLTGSNPTAAAHPTLTTIDVYGTRWGIATMIAALGTLVGTPIAGALADPATNSFLSAQAFAGAMMIVGALLYVWPLIAALKHDRAKVGVRDD